MTGIDLRSGGCLHECTIVSPVFEVKRIIFSGVTESLFYFLFYLLGGGGDLHRGGGGLLEDGIAMKSAQSKVKWEGQWGDHGVNGGTNAPQAPPPPIVTPLIILRQNKSD